MLKQIERNNLRGNDTSFMDKSGHNTGYFSIRTLKISKHHKLALVFLLHNINFVAINLTNLHYLKG